MLRTDDFAIFAQNKSTLKDVSRDKDFYMTNDTTISEVINFDKVKEAYIKNLGLTDTPKSGDALLTLPNGKFILIEFKNGAVDKRDIHRKIVDSLLIFADITKMPISYTRQHMDFMLVYNNKKYNNTLTNKRGVQESKSRDELSKGLFGLAKGEFIELGLSRFKKFCFNEVHTYNQSEFEKFLASIR